MNRKKLSNLTLPDHFKHCGLLGNQIIGEKCADWLTLFIDKPKLLLATFIVLYQSSPVFRVESDDEVDGRQERSQIERDQHTH